MKKTYIAAAAVLVATTATTGCVSSSTLEQFEPNG